MFEKVKPASVASVLKPFWGLIYKTVRGIVTKSVHTPKSQVLRAPENIRIYKTLRTHTVAYAIFAL